MLGDLEIGLPAAFWPERYDLSDENGERFHETGRIPLIKALDCGTVSAVKMYQRGANRQVQLLAYSNRFQDDSGKTKGAVGIFIPTSAVPAGAPGRGDRQSVVTPHMGFDYSQLISVIELAETIASIGDSNNLASRGDIQAEISEYIASRLTEAIRLEEIAAVVHRSPAYLTTLVHHTMGRPLMVLVREMRRREARRLLEATSLPIGTIARRTGPWDAASFARSFRDFHGCPPSEWRHLLRIESRDND